MNQTSGHVPISVIIPVYNESSNINSTIENIRTLSSGGAVEIIVVDSGENQETLKFIKDPRVIKKTSARGRALQMNTGAAVSQGEILLFLHADTLLPRAAFRIITETMHSGKYAAGAFTLSFDNRRLPFRLISMGARLRCRMTKIPFGDQGIFLSRDYFNRLGGYGNLPLMEDMDLMNRVKKDGKKIFISPHAIITSARKWESDGIARRTLKNIFIRILYNLGVRPEKLVHYYYRHL